MAQAIETEIGTKPELIKSRGGVFEVVADGDLIFSKKQEFRFPRNSEIIDKLKAM